MSRDVCLIFAGGPVDNPERLPKPEQGYVICADGGYLLAKRLNIKPDVVLGDFDSMPAESVFKEALRFPKEKDDTDLMLAIKLALSKGFKRIVIYGALGGRMDHTIASLQAMRYILNHGAKPEIHGENESLFLISDTQMTLPKKDDYYFSVFSFSPVSEGVTLKGVKYPLENALLTDDFPVGVSNEITADFCEVSVKRGILMVVYSKTDTPK